MPAKACTRHVHRGPQDRRPDGRCIHCQREAQKRYRDACRDARRRLAAIQELIA
jgi:hypothetical protein